jgi:predicted lipoprotein with Yx(FWY)xxD motif
MKARSLSLLVVAVALAPGSVASAGAPAHSAAAAAVVKTRHGALGTYLVDGRGRTLYLFQKDRHGTSTCYGSCAGVWAPYVTTHGARAAGGVKASKLRTVKRRNGQRQLSYGGHPLYYYAGDRRAGDTKGQGLDQFGAEWYVLAASGNKIDNG